jgi:hypothetical protein
MATTYKQIFFPELEIPDGLLIHHLDFSDSGSLYGDVNGTSLINGGEGDIVNYVTHQSTELSSNIDVNFYAPSASAGLIYSTSSINSKPAVETGNPSSDGLHSIISNRLDLKRSTIFIVCRILTYQSAEYNPIINHQDFSLVKSSTTAGGQTGNKSFAIWDVDRFSAAAWVQADTQPLLTDNTNFVLAATVDFSGEFCPAQSNLVNLYVDGIKQAKDSRCRMLRRAGKLNFEIGNAGYFYTTVTKQYIGEYKLYSGIMTDSEVLAESNSLKTKWGIV